MGTRKASGPADRVSDREPRDGDQLAGRINQRSTETRRGVQAISTPREAVQGMLDAGAVFNVHRRADSLGVSFTYHVAPGGDLYRARAILAAVKARPALFLSAFQSEVQRIAGLPVSGGA